MRRLGRARRLEFRWLLPGLALLAWWAFHEADSGLFQWGAARALAAAPAVRSVAPTPRAPRGSDSSLTAQRAATSRRVPPHGRRTLFGRVEIPRLGIRAMMTEGVDKQTLSRAIGHVPTTARPGEPGNCALAGHRDSFLRGLGGVRVDDVVRIVTATRTYEYRVEWTRIVDPHQVDVLDSTATRSLTLVTCYPFEFLGHAPQRFIVRAREVPLGWAAR